MDTDTSLLTDEQLTILADAMFRELDQSEDDDYYGVS